MVASITETQSSCPNKFSMSHPHPHPHTHQHHRGEWGGDAGMQGAQQIRSPTWPRSPCPAHSLPSPAGCCDFLSSSRHRYLNTSILEGEMGSC